MVGIMLVAFVGVGAIAADVGRFFVVSSEVLTAADAAALRGAVKLANTPGSSPQSIVQSAVVAFVNSTNKADNGTPTITGDSVRLGYWTPGTNGTQGSISYTLNGKRPNAVSIALRAAPRGTFAQLIGQAFSVPTTRGAIAWVASLGSNCVRPWAFPYLALYKQVSGNAAATSPAPDLDATQFSNYIAQPNSSRYFNIIGQNQTNPSNPPNDGEWTGFNFTGNAGKASFVDGINGCTSTRINPDAGQGVTLPGQANQYVNWSVDAVAGGGNGANAQPGICSMTTGNAGCFPPGASTPGVTINSAWGELVSPGSNGINFNYVGEFVITCFYQASTDVCPDPKPGTPNTGYPAGTIVGYIKTLKSRYITPDDVLGNFASNVIVIVLVK
jgi:hypothetical protein